MSDIFNGSWKNMKFKTSYIGIRKYPIFEQLPFWEGDICNFKLKFLVDSWDEEIFNSFGIMKIYEGREQSHLEPKEFSINKENCEIEILSDIIYSNETLEYWIGTPKGKSSIKIASFAGSEFDKFFAGTIIPILLTFIFSCIVPMVLGIIQLKK